MSGAARLFLVRHGHVAEEEGGEGARICGWFDPPLSPTGAAQAGCLAARLGQQIASEGLYTSPLRRARDTARIIAAAIACPAADAEGLREIHCGELEGLPIRLARERYSEEFARNAAQNDETFRWPGGESYREFRERILATVDDIAARHPAGRVVVVTHAGVVAQILGHLAGQTAARWDRFRPGHCSVTEVLWARSSGRVLGFDDTAHLDGLGRR